MNEECQDNYSNPLSKEQVKIEKARVAPDKYFIRYSLLIASSIDDMACVRVPFTISTANDPERLKRKMNKIVSNLIDAHVEAVEKYESG